jgi:transcription initiation factor TFIIIB Brf1 subunit/transcription initiation factor TFIIB
MEEDWDALDMLTADDVSVSTTTYDIECVSCKSDNVVNDYTEGCYRCMDCGDCYGQVLCNAPEWSSCDNGKGTEYVRNTQPVSYFYPKSSMSVSITGSNNILKRMNTWDSMPYAEQALSKVLNQIEIVCSRNRLPKAVSTNAKLLFKQIHDSKTIIRNEKNRHGIYGACVYFGAQLQGYFRPTNEIARMFNVPEPSITKGCNKMLKIAKSKSLLNALNPTTPSSYTERFCYILDVPKEHIDDIIRITNNVASLYLASNHQPKSVGATCVIIYNKLYRLGLDDGKIRDVFEVTEATTTKIYLKIEPYLRVIVDDDITKRIKTAIYGGEDEMDDNEFKEYLNELENKHKMNYLTVTK